MMGMPMMQVWIVRVLMAHRLMSMPMRMRFSRCIVGAMSMLMVFIMRVLVFVLHSLMLVLVLVPFGQMQPQADSHERSCD